METFDPDVQIGDSGVQTFDPDVQTFDPDVQTFHSGVQTFHSGLQTFHSGPQTFHSGVQTFHSGLQTFHFWAENCDLRLFKELLLGARPARVFKTTPEFWLRLQEAVDIRDAWQANGREYDRLKPLSERAA